MFLLWGHLSLCNLATVAEHLKITFLVIRDQTWHTLLGGWCGHSSTYCSSFHLSASHRRLVWLPDSLCGPVLYHLTVLHDGARIRLCAEWHPHAFLPSLWAEDPFSKPLSGALLTWSRSFSVPSHQMGPFVILPLFPLISRPFL